MSIKHKTGPDITVKFFTQQVSTINQLFFKDSKIPYQLLYVN